MVVCSQRIERDRGYAVRRGPSTSEAAAAPFLRQQRVWKVESRGGDEAPSGRPKGWLHSHGSERLGWLLERAWVRHTRLIDGGRAEPVPPERV